MIKNFRKEEIRKFLVTYYGLNQLDSLGNGKDGIIKYFERVRSVQFDPLNVVGKNTEIVLQSRFSDITPSLLDKLLYQDYLLVDGFDKEVCIYLMKEWKEFSHIRLETEKMDIEVLKYRKNEEALNYLDKVLNYDVNHTHSNSKDIKIAGGVKGDWGSSSLSNCALHHLWCKGSIGISKRNRSVKFYSDNKQLIPKDIYNKKEMSSGEFIEWYVARRLDSLGLYWLKRGAGWQGFYLKDINVIKETMKKLVQKEEVIEIKIDEMKENFYLTKKAYKILLESLEIDLEESIRFIAPLDNFIWDRKLIKELFDFEYTWEVYVPEAKRKYGYYVLPILYKDKLIGRLEPSRLKNRKNVLEIKNLWFEDKKYENKNIKKLLKQELNRFNKQTKSV